MTDGGAIDPENIPGGHSRNLPPTCPMCGAAIQIVARRCRSCGESLSRLVRRSRLQRAVEVTLPEGVYLVEYIGSRLGYELVQVHPGKRVHKMSWLWFVPRFDFDVGGNPAVIEVRVAPWLAVWSFSLQINDIVVYEE
jgi:hypothetical protein